MLEEVEAVPIQNLGRRESSASGAEDTAVGQVSSPAWQSSRESAADTWPRNLPDQNADG